MSPALGLIVSGSLVDCVYCSWFEFVSSPEFDYVLFLCFIVAHIGMSFILSCVFGLFVSQVLSVPNLKPGLIMSPALFLIVSCFPGYWVQVQSNQVRIKLKSVGSQSPI